MEEADAVIAPVVNWPPASIWIRCALLFNAEVLIDPETVIGAV